MQGLLDLCLLTESTVQSTHSHEALFNHKLKKVMNLLTGAWSVKGVRLTSNKVKQISKLPCAVRKQNYLGKQAYAYLKLKNLTGVLKNDNIEISTLILKSAAYILILLSTESSPLFHTSDAISVL